MAPQLAKRVPTGRDWGNKVPEQIARATVNGLRIKVIQNDAWEGPIEAGKQGEFFRCYWIEVEA